MMLQPSEDSAGLPQVYRDGALRVSGEPLAGDTTADVVVIGAGFTGLSAALHLAEAGRKVAIIEAEEVGWGASGRNFGQVVPYAKHGETHVLKHFGEPYGSRLLDAAAGAPEFVFKLIERLGIDCGASRNGLLFAAHSVAGQRGLEARAAFWQKRGAPVEMLDAAATASHIGSDFYKAALIDRRGGVVNPLALACGIANAAVLAGVSLHTRSRVKRLEQVPGGWRVATKDAAVTAGEVLVATDAYTDAFAPAVREALIPMRAYQFVSKPLSDNIRKAILPHGQPMTDTRRLFSGVRVHADGRLHVSLDGPAFSGGKPYIAKALERVRKLYPFIDALEWEEGWSGWVGMTADQYPRLVRLAPGCHAALGYSGRGIGLATLLGRELARLLTGVSEDDLVLPVTAPERIAVKPFAAPLVGSLMSFYRILDGVDDYRLTHHRTS